MNANLLRRFGAAALLAAGVIVAGCHGSDVLAPQTLDALSITPVQLTITPSDTVTLVAHFEARDGTLTPAQGGAWTTSDAGVATVDANGIVTAHKLGSVRIGTSAIGGRQAYASITVAPSIVASVSASPSSLTLTAGASAPIGVSTLDANGRPVSGRRVTFSSSNASIATVSDSGVVTAVAAGNAVVTVTCEGHVATVPITVGRRPAATVSLTPHAVAISQYDQQQLTLTALDASGAPASAAGATFASSNNGVVSVSSTGLVTGVSQGSATVYASLDGKSDSATVTVAPPTVYQVIPDHWTYQLAQYDSVRMAISTFDRAGQSVKPKSLTLASSNPAVATVSAQGEVVAVSQGTATITITADGVSATALVTVGAPAVASISVVQGPSVSLSEGGTLPLTVRSYDVKGNLVANPQLVFTSGNVALVAVGSDGMLYGLRATSTPVPVTVNLLTSAVSTTIMVSVTAAPVASIGVTPSAASISFGSRLRISAIAYDLNGNALPGAALNYSVSDASIATVDAQGYVTAGTKSGVVTVYVRSNNGIQAAAQITVTP